MFNHPDYLNEVLSIIQSLDVSTILEVGYHSGEIITHLAKHGYQVYGIDNGKPLVTGPNLRNISLDDLSEDEHYDLIFTSGVLEHFTKREAKAMLRKMAKHAKYILTLVPNSNCKAYIEAKQHTTAPWKDELDYTQDSLVTLHASVKGLKVLRTGFAGKEWTKLFGSTPSEPYLVWCLCEVS